jgi:hypothetical protein
MARWALENADANLNCCFPWSWDRSDQQIDSQAFAWLCRLGALPPAPRIAGFE